MTDWRKSAYLRVENWPEAIPPTGPKREYGPAPWGQKTHDDPHDLDDYPNSHPDAASVGETFLGDVCPYCGKPLDWFGEVVLIDGTRGTFADVDDVGDPTPAYHPECWRDREAERAGLENTTVEEFDELQDVVTDGGRELCRACEEWPAAPGSDYCHACWERFEAQAAEAGRETMADRLVTDGGLEFDQGERGLEALERIADAQERQAVAAELQAGAIAELVWLSMPGRNSVEAAVGEFAMWRRVHRREGHAE